MSKFNRVTDGRTLGPAPAHADKRKHHFTLSRRGTKVATWLLITMQRSLWTPIFRRKNRLRRARTHDPLRAPTREEVDRKVVEAQQKLAELKRAQEDLERERAALEELRRRQTEFQTGRQEMIHNLTRGLGLLEEAEFNARRDAEQMVKTIGRFPRRARKNPGHPR